MIASPVNGFLPGFGLVAGAGVYRGGELGARRSDLVGMRSRQDWLGDVVRCFVLELVDADLRPLRDDVEVAGMGDLAHVEHALDVVFHFS